MDLLPVENCYRTKAGLCKVIPTEAVFGKMTNVSRDKIICDVRLGYSRFNTHSRRAESTDSRLRIP